MNTNWTKKEFEVYVLLYAAHCNFIETEEERNYILSKVDEKTFNKIHTEIVIDNDKENLDKIQEYLRQNSYNLEDKNRLMNDIKNVFFADGSVDVLEKKVFLLLKKILN